MATTLQPLLESPKRVIKQTNYICLVLSLLALISSVAIFTLLINPPKESCFDNVIEIQFHLQQSIPKIQKTIRKATLLSRRINDRTNQAALADCVELMDASIDRIKHSILALNSLSPSSHGDAHGWLGCELTNLNTCLDGLEDGLVRSLMEPELNHLIAVASDSLAMLVAISPPNVNKLFLPIEEEFPSWVNSKERKLLHDSARGIKADVVVAKDGSGRYTDVSTAVANAPNNGKQRYVIHVKQGTYDENVKLGKEKSNIMLVGDGMHKTIITGNLSNGHGATTFSSATVAVDGDGFIAQDISFVNSAGPLMNQSVALRVSGDKAVINRCRIVSFQDTLYALCNRQFYTRSTISGTIDFIFGNAAVVLQKCTLIARKPAKIGQSNTVTAQGRTNPNQATGTSIQMCNITAGKDLEPKKASFPTYLGRPWKEYSRTVVMESNIGDHIDPLGWSPWQKGSNFALNTLYYGEYMNFGAGAGLNKRVNWKNYHRNMTVVEAKQFTVGEY